MIKKLLLLCLVLAYGLCFAQPTTEPLDMYVDSMHEQTKAVDWVGDTTKGKVDDAKAASIIRSVYAQAYSKNLNPHLVMAIIRVESTFQDNARSGYGAKGLMQVVPRWHKDKLQGRNPYNTLVSTEVGTTILQQCNDKSKGNLFKTLQCYSGGGGKKYFKKVKYYQYELAQSLLPREVQLAMK